jgi:hypothetical protein
VVPNAAEDEAIKRLAQQLMYGARDSALPDLVADKPRLELSVRFPKRKRKRKPLRNSHCGPGGQNRT